ncbi:MAG: 16S rRNA (cytosine(1402)-N(4))-methyltransferase, partial [bacterium]
MISNIINNIQNLIESKIIDEFIYIDCTLGLGNHFLYLYKSFNKYIKKNILIDKDITTINLTIDFLKQEEIINNNFEIINNNVINTQEIKIENIKNIKNSEFIFINDNFKNFIDYHRKLINTEDNLIILADLGISMYQIKNEEGFSFNNNTLLDMRYNKSQELKAKDIINKYNKQELINIFNLVLNYKDSEKLANSIIKYREKQEIQTTQDLNKIVSKIFSAKFLKDYLQKIYLALRIKINNELEDLEIFLENLLKIKNNFVCFIISYHSLEGKIIKKFLKINNLKYKKEKPLKEEIKINKPSRSALLWIIYNLNYLNYSIRRDIK